MAITFGTARLIAGLPQRSKMARSREPSASAGAADRPDEIVLIGGHLDSWDLGNAPAGQFASSSSAPRRWISAALPMPKPMKEKLTRS
jgi:hypothetical protein